MRILIGVLTIMLLGAPAAYGQSWCPPGATWEYQIIGFAVSGCGTQTYMGDTALDGRQAQRIVDEWEMFSYWDDTLFTGSSTVYTSFSDGVVHQYVPSTPSWDTLYWFAAPVGARWAPPGYSYNYDDTICPPPAGMLEVIDTGTVDMNGTALHYVDVKMLGLYVTEYRIYERIGNLYMGWLLGSGCIIVDGGYQLRTYSDQLGTAYENVGYPCPDFSGVAGVEWEQDLALVAYPNPGGDQLSLSWDVPGRYEVAIRDLQGRTVWRGHHRKGDGPLDVAALVPGMYTVTARTMDGVGSTIKWIKQ